jgi:ABC-2 type transport system ATP-binding protein
MLEGARNVYWRLTVRENLRFFAALAGRRPDAVADRHDELLEQFDLRGKADTAVRELSRGQKQKVALAATLARDAEVAFLDEPTLGLDVESSLELRRELRSLVEDEGVTLLVSSHDMDVIEAVCDRAIVMNEGQVVADDSVENLLSLFRSQTYRVTVEGSLPGRARDRLRARFDADEFDRRGGRERFVVSVTADEFYDLTDVLRDAGATVDSFDALDPDLEEVFLRLTDDDRVADGGGIR